MPLGGAFNPSDPNDITALRDEYRDDPLGQGYASAWAIKDADELTRLINADAASGATKSTSDFNGFDYADAITTTGAGEDAERAEVLGYDDPTLAAIIGAAASASTDVAAINDMSDRLANALAEFNRAQGQRETNLTNIRFFTEFRELEIPSRYQSPLLRPWTGLNTGTALIRGHLIELAQGPKSRAEELWTDGTVIRTRDTQAALKLETGA